MPDRTASWRSRSYDQSDDRARSKTHVRPLFAFLVACLAWAAPKGSLASPLEVPSEFLTGEVALAPDVNANFRAVETAVNDNHQRVGALADALSGAIGDLNAAAATIASLQQQIEALSTRVSSAEAGRVVALDEFVRVERTEINGLSGPHLIIEGANLHIRSGAGTTNEASFAAGLPGDAGLTGLGNLIVGYNEASLPGSGPGLPPARTGSHNVVIGWRHSYSSVGSLVAGEANFAEGSFTTIAGGTGNRAISPYAVVVGGTQNSAGTTPNSADRGAVVVGGVRNIARAFGATILGGRDNVAEGASSTVSGGTTNLAAGSTSSVCGGAANEARGVSSSVSGGFDNSAIASSSSVAGGSLNAASGEAASVSGGTGNEAFASGSSISGGRGRTVRGPDDWAAGDLFQDR